MLNHSCKYPVEQRYTININYMTAGWKLAICGRSWQLKCLLFKWTMYYMSCSFPNCPQLPWECSSGLWSSKLRKRTAHQWATVFLFFHVQWHHSINSLWEFVWDFLCTLSEEPTYMYAFVASPKICKWWFIFEVSLPKKYISVHASYVLRGT